MRMRLNPHKSEQFIVEGVFNIQRGHFHSIADLDPGEYVTISRIGTDHGSVGFYDMPEKAKEWPAKTITVSTVTGDAFVQPVPFIATDNVVMCSPKPAYNRFSRHSPDRTTFPGYSSRRDAANYNLAFQGRQMRPDSLKFLLSWTNHRPAKRKISKPLVYDQVSSLGSPFALYDPVTVINSDAPKVD